MKLDRCSTHILTFLEVTFRGEFSSNSISVLAQSTEFESTSFIDANTELKCNLILNFYTALLYITDTMHILKSRLSFISIGLASFIFSHCWKYWVMDNVCRTAMHLNEIDVLLNGCCYQCWIFIAARQPLFQFDI